MTRVWNPNRNYKAFLLFLRTSSQINNISPQELKAFFPQFLELLSQLDHEQDLILMFQRCLVSFVHHYIYKTDNNEKNLNKIMEFFSNSKQSEPDIFARQENTTNIITFSDLPIGMMCYFFPNFSKIILFFPYEKKHSTK